MIERLLLFYSPRLSIRSLSRFRGECPKVRVRFRLIMGRIRKISEVPLVDCISLRLLSRVKRIFFRENKMIGI